MAKTKNDIQLTNMSDKETSAKTKSKKTKNVETLEPKVSKVTEPLESKVSQVTEPLDNVKVDVEIDCTTNCCSNSSNQCVYIRRKRSI